MNDLQADSFIKEYFYNLFVKRDVDYLADVLDENYWDDDIGEVGINHIENSKNFLREWFANEPTILVTVKKTMTHDDIISSYLEWSIRKNEKVEIIRKGVASFVVKNNKIVKRHTFVYFEEKS